MATVTIAHHPELTPSGVMEIFRSHFADKYEISEAPWYSRWLIEGASRDFFVKKNSWVGVGVLLNQQDDGTSFVFTGIMPTAFGTITAVLMGGYLIAYLFVRPRWREMEADIQTFMENAAAFK